MSADTTDPNETVTLVEHTHDGYLVDDDLIDLSDLQLDSDDDWLYIPLRYLTESPIQDLYAWLRTEPELDVRNNKKCIDTRTFTRPKKRSARMSFESIFEGLPPTTDIKKLQNTDVTSIKNMEKDLEKKTTIGDKESVPPILKPSARMAMNVLADENTTISGQESMEAFLHISQSKGIDSFINLGEPEFNDLLMNTSQPSILNTSVIASLHESIFMKNDMMSATNKNIAQRNSDIKQDSNSGNVNETFVMLDAGDTSSTDYIRLPDKIYRTNICNKFLPLDKGFNETYNAEITNGISASKSSLNNEEMVTLSSTIVAEPNANATFVQSQNEASNGIKSLDITYPSSAKSAEKPNSPVSVVNDTYIPTRVNKADLNVTCDILSDETESAMFLTCETHAKESVSDMSFNVPVYNRSTPMNPNMPSATSKYAVKQLDQPQPTAYPTLKAPTSLRRELLAEIQRSGKRKLDSTYNHMPSDHPSLRDAKENIHVTCNENETNVFPPNRYHTYKKTAFTATANQYTSQNETAVTAQKELPMDQRKFYTFTKKSNPVGRTDNTANENVETRPSMNNTFCKPILSKALQKRNIPKTLSRLPQFLQKSNPNIVSSSLKTNVDNVPIGRMSSIRYIKGSQPNIVQNVAERSQLPSRLHLYGKMKSGSEQRLLEANVNTNNQFPMKSTIAGSTESIESTHSVHSAPDLDDRLSTCSDSSHNSCTKQTMNAEQLHKLVRMQEESLKQDSASKPDRQVLENTWIETKMDLLSPILKNGVEHCEIDRHLNRIDFDMKCSSPIISPTGSSHALNNDGNAEGNITKTKDKIIMSEKMEEPNQVVPKIENKTRLRQPTNWSTGSKPATVISGIPRPASRIPALRFIRPNAKTNPQADLRKGCT